MLRHLTSDAYGRTTEILTVPLILSTETTAKGTIFENTHDVEQTVATFRTRFLY